MSKILEASCVAGVVSSEGGPVEGAVILSEGVAESTGVLLLEEDRATYLAKTSEDLKDTLQEISSALGAIATALGTIDAKPVGGSGSAPAPAVAASISTINSAKASIDSLKAALR